MTSRSAAIMLSVQEKRRCRRGRLASHPEHWNQSYSHFFPWTLSLLIDLVEITTLRTKVISRSTAILNQRGQHHLVFSKEKFIFYPRRDVCETHFIFLAPFWKVSHVSLQCMLPRLLNVQRKACGPCANEEVVTFITLQHFSSPFCTGAYLPVRLSHTLMLSLEWVTHDEWTNHKQAPLYFSLSSVISQDVNATFTWSRVDVHLSLSLSIGFPSLLSCFPLSVGQSLARSVHLYICLCHSTKLVVSVGEGINCLNKDVEAIFTTINDTALQFDQHARAVVIDSSYRGAHSDWVRWRTYIGTEGEWSRISGNVLLVTDSRTEMTGVLPNRHRWTERPTKMSLGVSHKTRLWKYRNEGDSQTYIQLEWNMHRMKTEEITFKVSWYQELWYDNMVTNVNRTTSSS